MIKDVCFYLWRTKIPLLDVDIECTLHKKLLWICSCCKKGQRLNIDQEYQNKYRIGIPVVLIVFAVRSGRRTNAEFYE